MTSTAVAFEISPAVPPTAVERKSRLVPKVSIYAKHDPDCKWAGRSKKVTCQCPKLLQWYQQGKTQRKSLPGIVDLDLVEQEKRSLENQLEAVAKGETPKPDPKKGKTLEEAINLFVASKNGNVKDKHREKLNYELTQFRNFCESKNLFALVAIEPEHILEYRNLLVESGKKSTNKKKVGRLVGFFDFCVEMGWLTRNPAKGRTIAIRGEDPQKPKALTDDRFEQALAAIPRINGHSTPEIRTKLRSLMLLMRWSGLAVRDGVCIERKQFEKINDDFYRVFLHRAKTGEPVYCVLRAELVEQIFAGANPCGRYLYIEALPQTEKEMDNLAQQWGKLFGRVSEVAGLVDEHGEPYPFTSHSMRHTFVYWCLNHGIATEDVAAMIGDSVEIVAKHYSEWIHGRQERLTQRMMEALA